jgi:hypothetical protein
MNKFMNIKILFLLTGFGLLMSSCQECVEVDVPYTEQEPYSTTEKTNVTLSYEISDGKMWHRRIEGTILFGDNPQLKIWTIVTNTDKYGGTFIFSGKMSSQGNTIDFSDSHYISAGNTYKFLVRKEINPYSFKADIKVDYWSVKAPTITVDKPVTKYREITKYRKCNTCVEDCGVYYRKKSSNWWIWVIIGIAGIILYVKLKTKN